MSADTQLDRIERKLDRVEQHLRKLNGQVASHQQTLAGVGGRGGMIDDVRALEETLKQVTPGMTSMKTVWAALASVASIAAVIVALVIGMTS